MGLKIHNRPRGSGKTQECIERMKSDKKLLMLVRTREQRDQYPKELHDRIIFAKGPAEAVEHIRVTNPLKAGLGEYYIKTLLIDEGLLGLSRIKLAQTYFELGSLTNDVEMYCTDEWEPINTSFEKRCKAVGKHLDSQEKHTL